MELNYNGTTTRIGFVRTGPTTAEASMYGNPSFATLTADGETWRIVRRAYSTLNRGVVNLWLEL